MEFPVFFARVPTIVVHDPLAELLGATEGGLIEYGYADAVRLAGHSCPTVAGAYLMAVRMLRGLFPAVPPERGKVRVDLAAAEADGVSGVVGAVCGLLTGAAGTGGFKGLGGAFSRRHLLHYGISGLTGEVRMTRLDTGAALAATLDLSSVAVSPQVGPLLGRALAPQASIADRQQFAAVWQERVERILTRHFDDPALLHFH